MEKNTGSNNDLGELFIRKRLMLASAESCTGGLIGHMITNKPGASDYYLGGLITYSNEAKMEFLDVQQSTLEKFGAVSRETVLEMAAGVRQAFSNTITSGNILGISTSGIAGPTGGSPQKPVGTVWIGLSSPDDNSAFVYHFSGSREEIKLLSAIQAIRILLTYLRQ